MFGFFKNRLRYNGSVDTKLNNEYHIDTRNNDVFQAGVYLPALDAAWANHMNEDEAALFIATAYFCSLEKGGHQHEADQLAERLASVGTFGVERGLISTDRSNQCLAMINRSRGINW